MRLAALQDKRGRQTLLKRREAGERVSASAVGGVVKATAADVWRLDAEIDGVLAAGVGGDIGAVEVGLGPIEISLRTAASEGAGDNNLRGGVGADSVLVVVSDQEAELIDPFRGEEVAIADVDFVLQRHGAVGRFG